MTIPVDIHHRIRATRREKDISQEYLANLLGISQTAWSKIETGATRMEEAYLKRIADAMESTPEYISQKEYQTPQISNNNCKGDFVQYSTIENYTKKDEKTMKLLKDAMETIKETMNILKDTQKNQEKLISSLMELSSKK